MDELGRRQPAPARADIVVPASIGNLGPGFDALSVAIELYMRVRILEMRPSAPNTCETEFMGAVPPGDNRIEIAFRYAVQQAGVVAPGLRVEVHSEIPVRAGLGSSAAATIAGLRLFEAVTSPLLEDDVLSMACALEGHPDNAAACLLGGLVVSCGQDNGRVVGRTAAWPSALRFVVITPHVELDTRQARAVLPPSVPLGDAVFNLQRALLLLRAVESRRYDDLRDALRDRWHQPARAALVPALSEVLRVDHPAVLGVCLSGSGPSIAAIAAPGRAEEAAAVLADVYRQLRVPHTIRNVAAHQPFTTEPRMATAERKTTA